MLRRNKVQADEDGSRVERPADEGSRPSELGAT